MNEDTLFIILNIWLVGAMTLGARLVGALIYAVAFIVQYFRG